MCAIQLIANPQIFTINNGDDSPLLNIFAYGDT
jgi:hypothetical protein